MCQDSLCHVLHRVVLCTLKSQPRSLRPTRTRWAGSSRAPSPTRTKSETDRQLWWIERNASFFLQREEERREGFFLQTDKERREVIADVQRERREEEEEFASAGFACRRAGSIFLFFIFFKIKS